MRSFQAPEKIKAAALSLKNNRLVELKESCENINCNYLELWF